MGMLVFVGDLHGNFAAIERLRPFLGPEDIVVQVGDFGFYAKPVVRAGDFIFPDTSLLYWKTTPFKVYAIDGNHEDFRMVNPDGEVTEVRPNLYYVPRGTVLELAGKTLAFLGGGASIDKAWRTKGVDWFPEEVITPAQVARLQENMATAGVVDYLVTHTPGKTFIKNWFPPLNLQEWELPDNWTDPSAEQVDEVLRTTKFVHHICGHMHRGVYDGRTRCLNIDEVYTVQE
jgi:Icc-related predicted phosphoesterase